MAELDIDKWDELEQNLADALLAADAVAPKYQLRCSGPGFTIENTQQECRATATTRPPRPDWHRDLQRPVQPAASTTDESASLALARRLQAESDADFARRLQEEPGEWGAPADQPAALSDGDFARLLQAESSWPAFPTQPSTSSLPQQPQQPRQRPQMVFQPLLRNGAAAADAAHWSVGRDAQELSSNSSAAPPGTEAAMEAAQAIAARLQDRVREYLAGPSEDERLRQWRPRAEDFQRDTAQERMPTSQQRRPGHSAPRIFEEQEFFDFSDDEAVSTSQQPAHQQRRVGAHSLSSSGRAAAAAVAGATVAQHQRNARMQAESPDYNGIDWNESIWNQRGVEWNEWDQIAETAAQQALQRPSTERRRVAQVARQSSQDVPRVWPTPSPGLQRMGASSERRRGAPADTSAPSGRLASGVRNQTIVAPFRAPPVGTEADDALVECAICMEKFADGESLRTLPCLHKYHVACIDRWLTSNRQCPICKHNVLESG